MRSRAEALRHRSGARKVPGDRCVVGLGSKAIRWGRRVAGSRRDVSRKNGTDRLTDRCGQVYNWIESLCTELLGGVGRVSGYFKKAKPRAKKG